MHYWETHQGQFVVPPAKATHTEYKGSMQLVGLSLEHPAAETLFKYASKGFPARTGRPWPRDQMEEAIEHGPQKLALKQEAMEILAKDVKI